MRVIKTSIRIGLTISITVFMTYTLHDYLTVCVLKFLLNMIVVSMALQATYRLKSIAKFMLPLSALTIVNYLLFLILPFNWVLSIILSSLIVYAIDTLIYFRIMRICAEFREFSIHSVNIINDFRWFCQIHLGKLIQFINFKTGLTIRNLCLNSTSYFFRDFDYSKALLEYYAQNKRDLRILCTGCATGQEPYSIAMFCRYNAIPASITGIDISGKAIETAKQGQYDFKLERKRCNNKLIEVYQKYFIKTVNDGVRIMSDEIKKMVKFYQMDVCEIPPDYFRQYDFVFARKYLYYLPRIKQKEALKKILSCPKNKDNIFFCDFTKRHCKPLE